MLAHHDDAAGKKIRRKLWNVFWLLLAVTLIEIGVGLYASEHSDVSKLFLKCFFIFFTIVKAFYIVYVFMHLGDEARVAKWIIIAPFTGFILYLIFMLVMGEGNYQKVHRIDDPIINKEAVQADEGAAQKAK